MASFIKGSLETAATTLFSNLASQFGRRLAQDDGASSEDDAAPALRGPPGGDQGPGPHPHVRPQP